MMPGRDAGPSSTLGPDVKSGLVDPSEGYRADQLARRRAQRDCDTDIAEVRRLLDKLDAGKVTLEAFGWELGRLGARLGARAARGELAS